MDGYEVHRAVQEDLGPRHLDLEGAHFEGSATLDDGTEIPVGFLVSPSLLRLNAEEAINRWKVAGYRIRDLDFSAIEPLDVEDLEARARSGDAEAQYHLGILSSDAGEAREWLRMAAEQGHSRAQNELGVRYMSGWAVPNDDAEVAKWVSSAAEQGHFRSQYNLGVLYRQGRGVAQDDDQAAAWFRKAAELGDPDSQFALGILYTEGRGVPRNDVLGYCWLSLAAAEGDAELVEHREEVGQGLTAEQRQEGERLAAGVEGGGLCDLAPEG